MNLKENPETSSAREAVVNGPPETADGDGVINKALEKPIFRPDGQIWKDIGYPGDYLPIRASRVKASLPSGPTAIARTAPPEPSTEIARELRIMNKRRFPNSSIQNVNVGHEVLVVNTSFTTILPDQLEAFNENQEPLVAGKLNKFFEARFKELGIPATKDNPAEPSLKAVTTVKGSDHVPNTVSEVRVATFSMDVNETGVPSFVPSLNLRRSTPMITEGAEVPANLG